MARPPRGGLIGRVLAALRGGDSPAEEQPPADEAQRRDAELRIDAARERLKAEIPPRED